MPLADIELNSKGYVLRRDPETGRKQVRRRALRDWPDIIRTSGQQKPEDRQLSSSWIIRDFTQGLGNERSDFGKPESLWTFRDADAITQFPSLVTNPLLKQDPTHSAIAGTDLLWGPPMVIAGELYFFGSAGTNIAVWIWDGSSTTWGDHAAAGSGVALRNQDTILHKSSSITVFNDSGPSTQIMQGPGLSSPTEVGLMTVEPGSAGDDKCKLADFGNILILAAVNNADGLVDVQKSTDNGVNWSNVVTDIVDANEVRGAVLYVNPDTGEPEPFFTTEGGMFVVDVGASTARRVLSFVGFEGDNAGRRPVVWPGDGALYIPTVNGGLLRYNVVAGPGSALRNVEVSNIGLDRFDIPDARGGDIVSLWPTLRYLYAFVGGDTSARRASVWAWNGTAWHSVWRHGTANINAQYIIVTSQDDNVPRLHAFVGDALASATNFDLQYIEYPEDNPLTTANTLKYEAEGYIETPHFDAGLAAHNAGWFGVRLEMEEGNSGNETIDIHYEEDRSGDYSASVATAVIASGTSKWGSSSEGLSAKTMSMRFELNRRSGTNTERVVFREAEVYFVKDPATQWISEFLIDLTATAQLPGHFETRDAETIIADLETLESTQTLITYTIGKRAQQRGKIVEFEIVEEVEDTENEVTAGQRVGTARVVLAELA